MLSIVFLPSLSGARSFLASRGGPPIRCPQAWQEETSGVGIESGSASVGGPPWEREAFDALAARRAEEQAAREALDAAIGLWRAVVPK